MAKSGEKVDREIVKQRILSRAAKLHRTQRFHVRANFHGRFTVLCPCCGFIGKYHINALRYMFVCGGCRARYVPKITLMLIPGGGRRAMPPDFIIPDEKGETAMMEAFPLGDMEHWRHGGCTHQMMVVGKLEREEERENESKI